MEYLEKSSNLFSRKFQSYNEEMMHSSKGEIQQNIRQSPFP